MTSINLEPFIEIEGEKYTKSAIISMNFSSVKMLMAFIDDFKVMRKVARWYGSQAEAYVDELERSCNYK